MSKTSSAVKNRWTKNHYDRIPVLVKTGDKDKLQQVADQEGVTISRLFVDSVNLRFPGLISTLDKTLPANRKTPAPEESASGQEQPDEE